MISVFIHNVVKLSLFFWLLRQIYREVNIV